MILLAHSHLLSLHVLFQVQNTVIDKVEINNVNVC
jgi:hypothetical protein